MKYIICGLLLSSSVLIHTMENEASNLTNQSSRSVSFSKEDYQIFCTAHAIADSILNQWYNAKVDISSIDYRYDSPIVTLDPSVQTKQGILITQDSFLDTPKKIITPWGIWDFRGSYTLFNEAIITKVRDILAKTITLESTITHIHDYLYGAILAFNGVILPKLIFRKPEELIPGADARKLWVMMQNTKQRRDFEHVTLKSLCVAYIKKNLQQFESQLHRLPGDLAEVIEEYSA